MKVKRTPAHPLELRTVSQKLTLERVADGPFGYVYHDSKLLREGHKTRTIAVLDRRTMSWK